MAFNAGNAFITISPDMSKFTKELKAKFAGQGEEAGRAFAASFKSAAGTAGVKADADTRAASAKLDELTKKKRTAVITVKEVADKTASKTGTLGGLGLPGLAAAGGLALGPEALGLAAGITGIGVAAGSAVGGLAAFAALAKGPVAEAMKANADAAKGNLKALQALPPAEKQLASELDGLTKSWAALQKAETPVISSALSPWVKTATDGMQLLSPVVTDVANAIQFLGGEADQAIKSPFWSQFAGTFGASAQISLDGFGEAAGHVADALAHLFVAFSPDIDKLPGIVDKLATSFDNWSKGVTDKGLDQFLEKTFTASNLAALAKDGKELGTLVENIATASQEMSPLAFTGLSNVMTVLGSLTPAEIKALTALFIAIKGLGTISKGVSAVSGVVGTVKGLLGKGGKTVTPTINGTSAGTTAGEGAAAAFTEAFQAGVTAGLAEAFAAIGAEGETEAATAGTTWGTSAAGAFSTALGAADSLGLAGVFTTIGTEGSVEAGTAGTAMGTAAATAFGTSFGTESAVALTAVFAGEDALGAAEAAAGGAALGTAFATGFGTSLGAIGTAVAAAIPEAGLVAVLAAGVAGAALGTAFGLGFTLAFAATGAKDVVSGLKTDLVNSASAAGTWLQPAGSQAAGGFVAGFNLQRPSVSALGISLHSWVQSGAAGSGTWIQPHGQQAAAGFASGFTSAQSKVNAAADQVKGWVTGHLPDPLSWLVNTGVEVVQGMADGILSAAGVVTRAIESLIPAPLRPVVNGVLGVLPGFASGTPSAPAGWAWVGERGPELVRFAGGEQVLTNRHSTALASASAASAMAPARLAAPSLPVPSLPAVPRLPGVGSPLRGGSLQLGVTYTGPSGDAIAAIVSGLQYHVIGATGGDVQAALGQGSVRIP